MRLERFQRLVSKHALIQKKWGFRNFSQVKPLLKTGIEEVLHQHHPDHLIQITILAKRIGRMFFFTDFLSDPRFGISRIEKYQLISVGKQRIDPTITQLKYPLHDILFNIHDFSSFRTFFD